MSNQDDSEKSYSPLWSYASPSKPRSNRDANLFEFLASHTLENKLKKKREREERQLAKEEETRHEKALSGLRTMRFNKLKKTLMEARPTSPINSPGLSSSSPSSPLTPPIDNPKRTSSKCYEDSSGLLHYFTSIEVMAEECGESASASSFQKKRVEKVQPLVLWDFAAADQRFLMNEAYFDTEKEFLQESTTGVVVNPRFAVDPLTTDDQIEAHELLMRVLLQRSTGRSAYSIPPVDSRHTIEELQEQQSLKDLASRAPSICKNHESVSHPYTCEITSEGKKECFCIPESLHREPCGCEFNPKEEDCHLVKFEPGFVYRSHVLDQSMIASGTVVVCAVSGAPHKCFGDKACSQAVLKSDVGDWYCVLTKHITSGLYINIPDELHRDKYRKIADNPGVFSRGSATGNKTSGVWDEEEEFNRVIDALNAVSTSSSSTVFSKRTSVKKDAAMKHQQLGITSTFSPRSFDRIRTNRGDDKRQWFRSVEALQNSSTSVTNTTKLALSFLNPSKEISDYFSQKNSGPSISSSQSPQEGSKPQKTISPMTVVSNVTKNLCSVRIKKPGEASEAAGLKKKPKRLTASAIKSWGKNKHKKMMEVFHECTIEDDGSYPEQAPGIHGVKKTYLEQLSSVVDSVMKSECFSNSEFTKLSQGPSQSVERNGVLENTLYRQQWRDLKSRTMEFLELLSSLKPKDNKPNADSTSKVSSSIPGFIKGEWTYLASYVMRVVDRHIDLPPELGDLKIAFTSSRDFSLITPGVISGRKSDAQVKKKLTAVGIKYFRFEAMAK